MSTDTATSTSAAPVETSKTEPTKPSRAALVWRGTRTATTKYGAWRRGEDYLADVKAARGENDAKMRELSKAKHETVVANRRQWATNHVRVVVAVATGGWWPATAAYLLAAAWSWYLWDGSKDTVGRERAVTGLKAGAAAAVLSLVLGLINAALGCLALGWAWANTLWLALTLLVLVGRFLGAVWDGDAGNDLPADEHGKIERVDEVTADISTTGGVINAVAEPLKVPKKEIPDRFVVVGPELTWDAAHRWRDLTLQMSGRTADQARALPIHTRIAGNLQLPADWLVLDEGTNASQVVLHMAGTDPWPKKPTPSPIITNPTIGDVWVPQRVGLDLLGSAPQEITLVASSIAIGGDSGTGKTALERLLALLIVSDLRAQFDLFDFKGDGALSMYRPLTEEYSSSDDDEAIERFLVYLLARKRDLQARSRLLNELAERNRADVSDAKITRELAHRTDIDLRPRFCMADEIQDPIADKKYGAEITELLTYVARKGRSGGTKLILATQNWDVGTVPPGIAKVLSTRISLRQPDYPASAQILGGRSCKYRADLLPNVAGAAVIRPAGDGAALREPVRLIFDYVNTVDAAAACQRIVQARAAAGVTPAGTEKAAPPRVLVEMRRMLVDRGGRMPSVEMAAAMAAAGLITVTDEDRAGHEKTEDQVRQEKLADLVRPFEVRTRPDSADGNRMAYWLQRLDRRYGEVGVGPALARAEGVSRPLSTERYTASRDGSLDGSRRLRAVRQA